jgi:hypothetical protein
VKRQESGGAAFQTDNSIFIKYYINLTGKVCKKAMQKGTLEKRKIAYLFAVSGAFMHDVYRPEAAAPCIF